MRRSPDLTRREFSVALAAVTLTACARPAPVTAPTPVATPEPTPAAATQPTPSVAPAAPADPNAGVADALFTVVAARFGAHITEDQRASVRADILNSVRTAQRFRTTPLTNADDPFSVCVAPAETAAPRPRRRRA